MKLGMKVRKHDLEHMLKFNPSILEFHFSDSDLHLQLEGQFKQRLIVHCYEYFERKLLDIASLKETNQVHSREKSLELIQKAIDKTISLSNQFQGKPTLILHPGGYSLKDLEEEQVNIMKGMVVDSIHQLDFKGVDFLMENMPPYAWFFGGRWISNVFLSSADMIDYSKKTGLKICYDLCHSQLYCNKNNVSLIDELTNVGPFVEHYHLSDAEGVDGEGLQIGEGTMDFEKIIPILNSYKEKSFSIEVWKGHEQEGKGFKTFLDEITKKGLIVK